MSGTGLISPRGDYAKRVLHLVFENWACEGTHHVDVPANESGHVTTVALAGLGYIYILRLGVSIDFRIGPMNKPLWSERLMASAALTGRTMLEFCLPGVTGYLEESFVKEGLGPGLEILHVTEERRVKIFCWVIRARPQAVAHD